MTVAAQKAAQAPEPVKPPIEAATEPEASTAPPKPKAKRQKKEKIPIDLSDVPEYVDPIPSALKGSKSIFKGVYKNKSKWQAMISIAKLGGQINLGTFGTEREAGIQFARARSKYPDSKSKETLDLTGVPDYLPPLKTDKVTANSRYKGVTKHFPGWQARIYIPDKGGQINLGNFDSEEEAGIMYARARYKVGRPLLLSPQSPLTPPPRPKVPEERVLHSEERCKTETRCIG